MPDPCKRKKKIKEQRFVRGHGRFGSKNAINNLSTSPNRLTVASNLISSLPSRARVVEGEKAEIEEDMIEIEDDMKDRKLLQDITSSSISFLLLSHNYYRSSLLVTSSI